MTMSLTMCFMSHGRIGVEVWRYGGVEVDLPPPYFHTSTLGFTNSHASQSSSSGWLGGTPCAPKSSNPLEIPCPNKSAHKRLTITLAVSGLSLEVIHWARSSRDAR